MIAGNRRALTGMQMSCVGSDMVFLLRVYFGGIDIVSKIPLSNHRFFILSLLQSQTQITNKTKRHIPAIDAA